MSSQQPADELAKLSRESGEKSRKIVDISSTYMAWAQFMADLSTASNKVLTFPGSQNIDCEAKISSWQNLIAIQDLILTQFGMIQTAAVLTSGSRVAYEMVDFAKPEDLIHDVPIDKQAEIRASSEQLGQVIDQVASMENTLLLLRQFGLNKAPIGKKSSVELFETAWAAFEKPVTPDDPDITSLLPIRQCINETIKALIQLRPFQEPAGSQYDKVVSIGKQLKHDGISVDEIKSLAHIWYQKEGKGLVDKLSGSKDIKITREEWRSSLRRATLFLTELLQSLDPAKLRKRK